MKQRQSRLSIRAQLLALFGLVLLTGGVVLVVDEIDRRATIADLDRIREESIVGLRVTKSISDRYGIDLPGIIRSSTGSMASEGLREVRRQGIGADERVAHVVDRLLHRQERAPGQPTPRRGDAAAPPPAPHERDH